MAHDNIQAAIDAGANLGKPFEVEGVQAVLIPADAQLKTLEHLQELSAPRRICDTREFRNVDHFIEYHNRYATDYSTVMADVDSASFTSILDYHNEAGKPGNRDHQAKYRCPETEEWRTWKDANKRKMDQESFATFLEENHLQIHQPEPGEFTPEELDVIVEKLPSGTDMLEIAKTLMVMEKSNITSATNLHNGAIKIDYQEEINGTAGANHSTEIPTYFLIAPQLFKDGKRYLILCRFKYRKSGSNLQLWYELVRPHKSHEAAVKDVIDAIRNGRTEGEGEDETVYPGMARGHLYEVV